LGESYAKKGQDEKARTFYKKSLELDPENASAKKKLEMLKEERNHN
jgi:Flp pilus assembly protein TadD